MIKNIVQLRYGSNIIGYRLLTDEGKCDIEKSKWDTIGGIDHSSIKTIGLSIHNGKLASVSEINSGELVREVVDDREIHKLYYDYKQKYLDGDLVGGKYIVREIERANTMGSVEIWELGNSINIFTIYENDILTDAINSIESLYQREGVYVSVKVIDGTLTVTNRVTGDFELELYSHMELRDLKLVFEQVMYTLVNRVKEYKRLDSGIVVKELMFDKALDNSCNCFNALLDINGDEVRVGGDDIDGAYEIYSNVRALKGSQKTDLESYINKLMGKN